MEKYVSLTIGRLAFKDSFQFLEFPLEQLAKSYPDFPILKIHIHYTSFYWGKVYSAMTMPQVGVD